ncbi:vacuolar-processing enzyme-like [Lycium barbarum]|uniref:vacuolar-processing enzyme-like n=1 Tax=Lycium barbarum TaxID=112863 RepID=UPI00293E7CCD|nr:vacuolar-processing enzyme-like [Lycium barbarum]
MEYIKSLFSKVKELSSNFNNYNVGSHVKKYLNKDIMLEKDLVKQGFDPITANVLAEKINAIKALKVVRTGDVHIMTLWSRYKMQEDNSVEQAELREYIMKTVLHRQYLDEAVEAVRVSLFGPTKFFDRRAADREGVEETGFDMRRVVAKQECIKKMVRLFEAQCGYPLVQNSNLLGLFSSICEAGISRVDVIKAFMAACKGRKHDAWHKLDEEYYNLGNSA